MEQMAGKALLRQKRAVIVLGSSLELILDKPYRSLPCEYLVDIVLIVPIPRLV